MTVVRQSHQLILYWDIDNQTILQTDWTRAKLVTSNQNWWSNVLHSLDLYTWKNLYAKISLAFFDRYWWSKNSAIWLNERHKWPRPTKCISPIYYFCLMKNSIQENVIISRYFVDQRILKFDWLKSKSRHTEAKGVVF